MLEEFVLRLLGLFIFVTGFWALRRKVAYPLFFPRLTFSQQYFPVRYWLLVVTYFVVVGALIFWGPSL